MSELQSVRNKIESACLSCGRKDRPELVAVSKQKRIPAILKVYEEGQRVFGENYVQELIEKKKDLDERGILDVDFHFIGHLQSNKVKQLISCVSTIQSVGSLRLLDEIASRAAQLGKKINCYFEVNVDEQASKGGFLLKEVDELLLRLPAFAESVISKGLMCIPDPTQDSRSAFMKLREIGQKHADLWGSGLSMGMSQDYEVAIECGATVVRVGAAIFGSR